MGWYTPDRTASKREEHRPGPGFPFGSRLQPNG